MEPVGRTVVRLTPHTHRSGSWGGGASGCGCSILLFGVTDVLRLALPSQTPGAAFERSNVEGRAVDGREFGGCSGCFIVEGAGGDCVGRVGCL